jgi:hypothetical protein
MKHTYRFRYLAIFPATFSCLLSTSYENHDVYRLKILNDRRSNVIISNLNYESSLHDNCTFVSELPEKDILNVVVQCTVPQ